MTDHHHHTVGNIRLAFFLNFSFTVFEILGGLWTGSLAILSDAIHDLGDTVSLGMAWYLERFAQKGEDQRFSYGYRRFSLVGALVNAVVLVVGSLFILSHAVPAILDPQPVNAAGMVAFAVVGVLVNGAAAFRLRSSKSLNAKVVAWHLVEDVLGWVAVLAVGITLLFTDSYVLDPILSVLIALYVLANVFRHLKKTVSVFLQSVPPGLEMRDVLARVHAVDHVRSTHHMNVWSLDGEHHVLTTHVVVEPATTRDQARVVKDSIKRTLEEFEFTHVTLEIEFGEDDCCS